MTRKEYVEQVWQARRVYSKALRYKQIERKKICQICDSPCRVQGHHQDYSRPLEVVWLCQACHKELHQRAGRDRIGRLGTSANAILKDMMNDWIAIRVKHAIQGAIEGRAKGEVDLW